jgi:23S rRNA pseudouridine1911/1915/1917 synthase
MQERIHRTAAVPLELGGGRLDQVAARLFDDYSRSRLQSWIRSGALTVDGRQCRPRDRVPVGAELLLDAGLEPETGWRPQPISLDVVYEDEAILVIDKPAGLVVHPAAGHAEGTLVNALLHYAPELALLPRGGIVHRLDRDTSGILVVARTLSAHHDLVAQLQARSVRREYLAVCSGALTGGGTVDAPIGRHPHQRTRMAVLASGGKPAITHYRVLERFRHYTALAVRLETGRTHQIRVHMAHRRYPLLGDPVYGGRLRLPPGASAALAEVLRDFRRQALHARVLGLQHPVTGAELQFECPLPDDLQRLLNVLRQEDPADVGSRSLD